MLREGGRARKTELMLCDVWPCVNTADNLCRHLEWWPNGAFRSLLDNRVRFFRASGDALLHTLWSIVDWLKRIKYPASRLCERCAQKRSDKAKLPDSLHFHARITIGATDIARVDAECAWESFWSSPTAR